MPSGFFCLLRFYLRVDHTMVRIHDTRFYHEAGTNFILREHSKRENKTSDLKVPFYFLVSLRLMIQSVFVQSTVFFLLNVIT